VDTRVWHQVGLELRKIHVQSTIESEGCSEGRDHLGDESVQVGVGGALDVQRASAHIVQGLVIEAEGAVGVLQKRVRREHMVVWLHDSGGNLGGRGDGE